MRPTFSLIIPTRNRADALAENLERLCAVAAELPDDVEIIVADNASTDRTPDVVADRFPTVQLIRLDENLSTAARNVAAQSARGSVLVMLDDDSYLHAPDLLRIERVMRDHPEVHCVAARVRRTGPRERHEGGGLPGVFIGCGAAIRRDVFLELRGYPLDYDYYVEEYDFCIRVWQAGGQVRWFDDIVVYHQRDGGNRDFDRIVRHLTRNNLRLWHDYAPLELRDGLMFETVERYARMARRENAQIGYVQGLTESAHLLMPDADERAGPANRAKEFQPRRRLTVAEFDLLYGLDEARRLICGAFESASAGRVAMWGRGKGAEQLVRLMTEMDRTPAVVFDPYLDVNPAERQGSGDWYGLEVLPGSAIVSDAPGVLVIGSLSPGACRDLAVQARRAAPNAHVVEPVPWRRTDEIDVSAAPALVGSPG